MAGHALAISNGFPLAKIIGVEPAEANDFQQSFQQGRRIRVDRPQSICDGLLSYDVGENNWPILERLVSEAVVCSDLETRRAMKWLFRHHGLRSEASGAITLAAALENKCRLDGNGDIVLVLSGRNIDPETFEKHIDVEKG